MMPPASRRERVAEYYAYQGPLPPPSMLQAYDVIIDNGADRIMRMAERQQQHRLELERHTVFSGEQRSNRALYILGVIVGLSLVCGTVLMLFDRDGVGLVTALGPLVASIATYFYGHRKKSQDIAQQRRRMQSPAQD